MKDLSNIKCEVCRVGAPRATNEEADSFMEQLPNWEMVESDGIYRLIRSFTFKDFVEALASPTGSVL